MNLIKEVPFRRKFVLNRSSQFVGRVEKQNRRDDDQDEIEEDGVDEGSQEGAVHPIVGDPGVGVIG